MPLQCKICKNLRIFSDPTTIILHMLVGGFVEDYMILKYLGETIAPPPTNNPMDKIIQDEQFDRMFDAYDDFDGDRCDDEGVGGFHDDGIDEGPVDGDSTDDELDDGDFLSQLLHHTKAEGLVGSAKGLANFEMVKKLAEDNVYERSRDV